MKNVSLTILLLSLPWSTSFAEELCTIDPQGGFAGCSVMVRTGEPMDPLIFVEGHLENGARVWRLRLSVLRNEWPMLNGEAQMRVDGGEAVALKYLSSNRVGVTKVLRSEAAEYVISEESLRAIANARNEVSFRFPDESSEPIEISVAPDRFSEIAALLAEAEQKL